MCGICGAISTKPLNGNADKLEKLMVLSEKRGQDALGFYATNLDGSPIVEVKGKEPIYEQLWKNAVTPKELFGKLEGSIDLSSTTMFLAHTRSGSKFAGDPADNKNNHPFISKDFVLAHNGACQQHKEIKKELGLEYDSECDSPVILHAIQKRYDELENEKPDERIVKAVQQGVEDVASARMSCWLVHRETKRVFFWRTFSHPLHYVTYDTGLFVFASEINFIQDTFKPSFKDIHSTTAEKIYELQWDNELEYWNPVVVGEWKQQTENFRASTRGPTSNVVTSSPKKKKGGLVTTLGQRLSFLGSKFGLDMQFSRRSDGLYVVSTKQEEAMEVLENCPTWKESLITETFSDIKFYVLHVPADTVWTFLDDMEEAIFRINYEEYDESHEFVRFLKTLDGVHILEYNDTNLKILVKNDFSKQVLQKIGLTVNNEGVFHLKRATSSSLNSSLKGYMKRAPVKTN